MIKRSVKIDIGGEEREVKFTIQALEELEAMLNGRDVFSLAQKSPWSVTEIVAATYCGLKVYDRKLTYQTAQKWVAEYATTHENGMVELYLKVFAALGLSGLIGGERSAFENILGNFEKEDESSEGK